ncbi:hypothetical protein JCM8097_006145 [Rhodosporidiobolus ruineniae]
MPSKGDRRTPACPSVDCADSHTIAGQAREEEEAANAPKPEPSLATTKPHVAPDQATKLKTKRTKSSASNKRKAQQKEAAMERAQKLEHRRDQVEGKKDKKKKARSLWQ